MNFVCRLQKFVGGELIAGVRINPRHLYVEVQYQGFREWDQLTSWQSAPLAVQTLIGELPAMISRPWVIPEGVAPQAGEVVASSSRDTTGTDAATRSSPQETDESGRDHMAEEGEQFGQDAEEEVIAVVDEVQAKMTQTIKHKN